MKKSLSVILSLLMLFSVVVPVFAIDQISTENAELEKFIQEAEYAVAPEHLFPFVLVPDKEELFDDAWGTYEEVEGYMYVKNLETKEIVQISDEPVYPVFDDTAEHLYFITEDNQLVQTDYTGRLWQVLYEAEYGDLASVWYRSGNLFFLDGEYICKHDLADKLTVPLKMVPDVVLVYPCADGTLLLRKENKEYFAYDYQTRSMSTVLDEYETNALLSADSIPLNVSEQRNNTQAMRSSLSNNISFPLSSYHHGSYFTKNGAACNHSSSGSSNCDDYRGSMQCWGFAQMVYERYSHISESTSYTVPSADKVNYDYVRFQSDADVRQYFCIMHSGSHVRLSRDSASQDEYDPGTHSLVFVSVGTTTVATYDANRIGNCRVAYESRTFSDIRCSYPYKIFHLRHTFASVPTQYSATFHKVKCTYCIGYILSQHTFVTSGNQTVCSECGYVQ